MTQTFDRRELIIEQLLNDLGNLTVPLLGGPNGPSAIVPGHIVHNRNELDEDLVPGIILLDADEVRSTTQTMRERGLQESKVPIQVMRMTPEIYVVLDPRGNVNLNVGADLNTARLAILGAVLVDTKLQQIVGANGNIIYDGCVTDLARNRAMRGQLGISITFQYPLLPKEYVGI